MCLTIATNRAARFGRLLAVLAALSLAAPIALAQEAGVKSDTAPPVRPRLPGVMKLHGRSRQETAPNSGQFKTIESDLNWQVAETAIIICDMWEDHCCQMSAHRVDVMAPQMNRVISAARSWGVQIIHAPSDGMPHYADTPWRLRVQQAPAAKPPFPLKVSCLREPGREPEFPIPETTTIRAGCDDPVYGGDYPSSRRQHPAIKIVGYDGVSDNGGEIYNFLEQLGIKNVVLMGVHTHHCVLVRGFGIRQMIHLGKNVVLCRDLTDAMYDPRQPPYVSHQRGTEMAIEHIEKYWCPSIESGDLMTIVPGSGEPTSQRAGAGNGD